MVIGGFIASPPPTLEASEDEDDNGDVDADGNAFDDKDDRDASSSSVDKVSTCYTYPLSLVTKEGSSFGYESSHTHRGRVSIGDFC